MDREPFRAEAVVQEDPAARGVVLLFFQLVYYFFILVRLPGDWSALPWIGNRSVRRQPSKMTPHAGEERGLLHVREQLRRQAFAHPMASWTFAAALCIIVLAAIL